MPQSPCMGTTLAQQIFSLEEVNALVPELTRIVAEQLDMRRRIESMLDGLVEATVDVSVSTSESSSQTRPTTVRGDITLYESDSEEVRRRKREIARRIDEYHRGWARVEAMGGVLKDPREGLVDFYGKVSERLVWLCWRFGETQCNHYHQLDEGFAGRKRIEESGRRAMLN